MHTLLRPRSLAAASLALAALMAADAPRAAAQEGATVEVTVADSATQAPIAGVRVTSSALRWAGVSDAAGRVRLRDLPPGTHTVLASHPGHAPREAAVTLRAGETAALRLVLVPTAVTLERLRVEGRSVRLQEFYARAEGGGPGYFVTRAQIERRRARRFTDALRGLPGVRVVSEGGRSRLLLGRALDQRGCSPRYYLDGVVFNPGNLDVDLRPELIEGVEVYPGGQVPPRFPAGSAACGVVLVWTRDRL